MTKTTLDVDGMHCASCVSRVEKALAAVPGVASARVDLMNHRARVQWREAAVASALLAAVRNAGYDARVRDEAEDLVEKVAEGSLGGTETVLIVEDEEQILMLSRRILEQYGYRVLTAGTPGDACRLAEKREGDIHLLLTDVILPEMNGKELKERVEAVRPGIKTLFMSGYTADAIARRGILEKGVDLLQKPFTLLSLARKVRQVLDSEKS